MTAEDIFSQVQQMPAKERIRFFSLIATSAFKEDSTHEEVFGHLKNTRFSAEQAAEYLEVSLPTLRRYVQSGRLKPSYVVGRSQLFATADLRRLKMKRA
jgi:excisionase family DNA binding protein